MKPWRFSGYRCPECGGVMIINHMGHECSERGCDYIEPKFKPSDDLLRSLSDL